MSLVIDRPFHFKPSPRRTGGYRLKAEPGHEPPPQEPATEGVHPLARRMAVAIEAKRLIESGVVADAAEMARVAGVTRARMTQIMNLTLLAPDIQEVLLYLGNEAGQNQQVVRHACSLWSWQEQRTFLARA